MAPQTIHLPDGQTFTVTPVFAGLFFKSHELNLHNHPFPSGWTVVLHTEDDEDDHVQPSQAPAPKDDADKDRLTMESREKKHHIHSFTKPTLQNDNLFISSISNPSNNEFKPAVSPTRQMAMMLWITLFWYFHQPHPSSCLQTGASKDTPESGKPRGDWRINIKAEGVFRGRNLIPKLERMGLIASLDSYVGTDLDDNHGQGWANMFVSRKMFWQIPARLFLFTLQPNINGRWPSSNPTSPGASRPGTPMNNNQETGAALVSSPSFPIGPFTSTSHLPTYYPPPPLQYTTTNHVRHPIRPKPPRMGEVFYSRFIPSAGQYLSFRTASLSNRPVPYRGPVGPAAHDAATPNTHAHLTTLSDTALLQMWMARPRVSAFWGEYVPNFLSTALASTHSFPAIGLWDGVPFGYFEIYWVKEDAVGHHAVVGDWDRGFHVLVGEEWARGRVQAWLSSLVHWALCADYRTDSLVMEPRIDNAR
jgi:hypothetical protein